MLNKNEGKQEFTLREAADGRSIVLDVAVGKFMDTSLLECDVQPRFRSSSHSAREYSRPSADKSVSPPRMPFRSFSLSPASKM